MEALHELGWAWTGTWQVCREAVPTDLLTVDIAAWAHMVREALRMKRWREASARRMDMNGLEHGVDREATNTLWRSQTGKAAGVLRGVIAGSIWTQDRRHRAKFVTTDVCPHCSTGAIEDLEHLYWHCAAWASIRQQYPDAVSARSPAWPHCLAFCGIIPLGQYPTAAERTRVVTVVQHMLTAIIMARDAQERQATAPVTRQEGSYPWGWNPPGDRLHFGQHLDQLPIPHEWSWDLSYFHALVDYLRRLE